MRLAVTTDFGLIKGEVMTEQGRARTEKNQVSKKKRKPRKTEKKQHTEQKPKREHEPNKDYTERSIAFIIAFVPVDNEKPRKQAGEKEEEKLGRKGGDRGIT